MNNDALNAAGSTVNSESSTEREMRIDMHPGAWVQFEGTQAQLEAEGVIPDDMIWPPGTGYVSWASGEFCFSVKRCRPYDLLKGSMKLWTKGDWWCLRMRLNSWTALAFDQLAIKEKAKELKKLLYQNTERGRAEFDASRRRYYEALEDDQFQAFLEELMPPTAAHKAGRGGARHG